MLVCSIDKSLEAIRTAIRLVDSKECYSIVAPAMISGKRSYGQKLHMSYA